MSMRSVYLGGLIGFVAGIGLSFWLVDHPKAIFRFPACMGAIGGGMGGAWGGVVGRSRRRMRFLKRLTWAAGFGFATGAFCASYSLVWAPIFVASVSGAIGAALDCLMSGEPRFDPDFEEPNGTQLD
jgi:hypothetical protein